MGQLAILSLLLLLACPQSSPNPVPVQVVRIQISGLEGELSSMVGAAEQAARQALIGQGVSVREGTAGPAAGLGDFSLRVRVGVQRAQGEPVPLPLGPPPEIRVLCTVTLRHEGPRTGPTSANGTRGPALDRLEHVGMTQKALALQENSRELASLILRLIGDSVTTVAGEFLLLGLDSPALIARAAATDASPAHRRTAMQILGQRRESRAVPVLTSLIRTRPRAAPGQTHPHASGQSLDAAATEATLRDVALGVLVAIGDRSAVRPLLDSVAFADERELGKLLEAVASLGGPEAEQYLTFVQASHPSAALRKEAATALGHLRAAANASAGAAAAPK